MSAVAAVVGTVYLTLQEMFDRSAGHLLTQKAKSTRFVDGMAKPECVYRNSEGLKCAASVFIPDACYDGSLEGQTVNCPKVQNAMPELNIPTGSRARDLLVKLQYCHDDHDVEQWPRRLFEIADDFSLNTNIFFK